MTSEDVQRARKAIAELPDHTSHGESSDPAQVYLPPSHVKAMDPDALVVVGMRGAGKTFWWSMLQDAQVRQQFRRHDLLTALNEDTEVRKGFGVTPSRDYPSRDVLQQLLARGVEPRIIWRTVQAWQLAEKDHSIRERNAWQARAEYVKDNPESIDRLFLERDDVLAARGVHLLLLFDALDRCADDWSTTHRMIRGLLQTALDLRSYKRLRVKVFLRSDQVDESRIADFPDAAKVLASRVELRWPRHELYGLLWHHLANGAYGGLCRSLFTSDTWPPETVGDREMFVVPRRLITDEDHQRERFHRLSGPWMGKGPKRGFPYPWIPNHLSDVDGRVSARSFLAAMRTAAGETMDRYETHKYVLHYDSIKKGVQKASRIRVGELQEDYPWVHRVLKLLGGMSVPCEFDEIAARWPDDVIGQLDEQLAEEDVKLLPPHIKQGAEGIRQDLEELRVFQRLFDGRVNIPDVFRVGYGLGRKGGVKPVR